MFQASSAHLQDVRI